MNLILEGVIKRLSNIISGKTKLEREILKSIVLLLFISTLLFKSHLRILFNHNTLYRVKQFQYYVFSCIHFDIHQQVY